MWAWEAMRKYTKKWEDMNVLATCYGNTRRDWL